MPFTSEIQPETFLLFQLYDSNALGLLGLLYTVYVLYTRIPSSYFSISAWLSNANRSHLSESQSIFAYTDCCKPILVRVSGCYMHIMHMHLRVVLCHFTRCAPRHIFKHEKNPIRIMLVLLKWAIPSAKPLPAHIWHLWRIASLNKDQHQKHIMRYERMFSSIIHA